MHHPVHIPTFNGPSLPNVDHAFILRSNAPYTEAQSAKPGERPTEQYLRADGGLLNGPPFRLSSSFNAPTSKPVVGDPGMNFIIPRKSIEPLHSQAFISPSPLFCCQDITILQPPFQKYERALGHFVTDMTRHIRGIPSYTAYTDQLGLLPTDPANPNTRNTMYLLPGARIFKVMKEGDHKCPRYFVGNVNDIEKYWELAPGIAVRRTEWINQLVNATVQHYTAGRWRCNTHGVVWSISILEGLFDDVTSNSSTNTSTMRVGPNASGTKADSGKAGVTLQGGIRKRHKKKSSSNTSSTMQTMADQIIEPYLDTNQTIQPLTNPHTFHPQASENRNIANTYPLNQNQSMEGSLINPAGIENPLAIFNQDNFTTSHQALQSYDYGLEPNMEGLFDGLDNDELFKDFSAFHAADSGYDDAAADYDFGGL
jgi:hypothetical protein